MLSNNQIKFIRSLHQAKFRKLHRLFLAEGPKVVDELIRSDYRIKTIIALEEWVQAHKNSLSGETELITVSPKELERASTLKSPNEVLAVVEMAEKILHTPDPGKDLVLVLDGINDPGNLGTIIRTADWFGFRDIICSADCVELYNPKVVQATMGSLARVQVAYTNLPDLFGKKPAGIPVYGALLDGRSIYREQLENKGYLIIGSESHGISEAVKSYISAPLSIPSFSKAPGLRAESLNASIATAILCAEFRRRSH